MPLYTATTRIIDGSGQVTAVRQSAFFVCGEGDDHGRAAWDLEQAARDLEEAAADLEAAAHDANHRHHHWWVSQ